MMVDTAEEGQPAGSRKRTLDGTIKLNTKSEEEMEALLQPFILKLIRGGIEEKTRDAVDMGLIPKYRKGNATRTAHAACFKVEPFQL